MAAAWITKLKGIGVLGAVGGVLGAIVGGVWFAISGLLSGSFIPGVILNAAAVYGFFGAFSSAGFAVFLANARARASIEDLSVGWSGLVGGMAGAAFPLAFNVVMSGSLTPFLLIEQFLPIMLRLGLFGAALTSGMVAVAKRSHRAELESGSEPDLLSE
jgi:hypothetical protein